MLILTNRNCLKSSNPHSDWMYFSLCPSQFCFLPISKSIEVQFRVIQWFLFVCNQQSACLLWISWLWIYIQYIYNRCYCSVCKCSVQLALHQNCVVWALEPDSNGVHLLEYSTSVQFWGICTLLEYHLFLGSTHDFTRVHLRGKYCTLYSTTFLSITMNTRYYF